MKKSKLAKTISAILIAMTMLVPTVALTSACADNNPPPTVDNTGKKPLPESEYPDEVVDDDVVDNTPDDDGVRADHIIQAEAAQFNGVSVAGLTQLDKTCMATSYFFDLSLGGSACIRLITSTANSFVYNFTSDKAVKCTMEVCVATAYSGSWVDRALTEMYEIRVNRKTVDTDVVVKAENKGPTLQGNNYSNMQTVEVPVTLKEGENQIMMRVLPGVCNLDYINIKTSANITYEDKYWNDEETQVTVTKPTAEKSGTINFKCTNPAHIAAGRANNTFTLPALAKDKGYIEGEDGSYSFPLNGETISVDKDGVWSGPDWVTFVDADAEPEPEPEPEPPAEATVVENNDLFVGAKWDKWSSSPVLTEGTDSLSIKGNARFNLFYAPGVSTHLAEAGSKLNASVLNKEYVWNFDLAADGKFDMLLFNSANLKPAYETGNGGVYLTFEQNKVSLRNAYWGNESAGVIGEAETDLTLDGNTKHAISISVNRVNASKLTFKITVDGTELVFVNTETEAKVTNFADDGWVTLSFTANGCGQRLSFVTGESTVTLSKRIG